MRRARWFGPYKLLDRIASGGMAEIYRAVLTTGDGTDHPVAIKRLLSRFNDDEEFIVMLTDEARITGHLDHPNIAAIYEFGAVDDQHFLAMEYIDGRDLRALLRRCRERDVALPPEVAAYVVEQALRGLHCAHEQRADDGGPLAIIHRDFSPSNILVSYAGEVKLIDFGIAKANLNRARTRGGVIKGKVKYMSPEQTLGKRLDRRSDVFAAGVVLYHAVTGHPPFHAPDDVELMVAIREQTPDPPSRHTRAAGPHLDALVARALAKDPDARFATAAEFADALAAWLRARDPDFGAEAVGRFLTQVFAREKHEADEALREYDLHGHPGDETPTGQRCHYTRLVDAGHFTDPGEPPEPVAEVEAWLAARRAGTAPPHEDTPWSSDERPRWVDDEPDDG